MISIQCNSKNSFLEVLTKIHKDGYLLANVRPDVHHTEPYERYITLFEDKTFEWSSFKPKNTQVILSIEYLSVFVS